MLFRQLFDAESSTYTYLLGDEASREAIVIDPVLSDGGQAQAVLDAVADAKLELVYSLETHIHADHISAGSVLRDRLGAQLVLHALASACGCADLTVVDGDELTVGSIRLRVLGTPGHTVDSVSYLVVEPAPPMVLTGDALLIGTCGRTDFQGGDAGGLYDSIHGKLFALADEVVVWPGHDYRGRTSSTIGEERRTNARLAGRTRPEFIQLMSSLHLPPPTKIGIAVPLNQHCGHEPHGR